jgi:hypothetical protein
MLKSPLFDSTGQCAQTNELFLEHICHIALQIAECKKLHTTMPVLRMNPALVNIHTWGNGAFIKTECVCANPLFILSPPYNCFDPVTPCPGGVELTYSTVEKVLTYPEFCLAGWFQIAFFFTFIPSWCQLVEILLGGGGGGSPPDLLWGPTSCWHTLQLPYFPLPSKLWIL